MNAARRVFTIGVLLCMCATLGCSRGKPPTSKPAATKDNPYRVPPAPITAEYRFAEPLREQ